MNMYLTVLGFYLLMTRPVAKTYLTPCIVVLLMNSSHVRASCTLPGKRSKAMFQMFKMPTISTELIYEFTPVMETEITSINLFLLSTADIFLTSPSSMFISGKYFSSWTSVSPTGVIASTICKTLNYKLKLNVLKNFLDSERTTHFMLDELMVQWSEIYLFHIRAVFCWHLIGLD